MLGKLVAFAVGMYAGIYADQNYKIPKANEPKELWARLKEIVEQYKKDNPGPKSD